jgi:hypothetical protein
MKKGKKYMHENQQELQPNKLANTKTFAANVAATRK